MAVRAMNPAPIDFLTKPFRNQDLLDAVAAALEQDRARRTKEEVALRRCGSTSNRSASASAMWWSASPPAD